MISEVSFFLGCGWFLWFCRHLIMKSSLDYVWVCVMLLDFMWGLILWICMKVLRLVSENWEHQLLTPGEELIQHVGCLLPPNPSSFLPCTYWLGYANIRNHVACLKLLMDVFCLTIKDLPSGYFIQLLRLGKWCFLYSSSLDLNLNLLCQTLKPILGLQSVKSFHGKVFGVHWSLFLKEGCVFPICLKERNILMQVFIF